LRGKAPTWSAGPSLHHNQISKRNGNGLEGLPSKDRKPLVVYGYNARSVCNPFNRYELYKLLKHHSPDIIIIVETWIPDKKTLQLKDRRYKVTNVNHTERRGVAIIHRSRFHASRFLSQFDSGHMLSIKINANPENLIVVALYAPPNYEEHRAVLSQFINMVEHLKQRYATFSLLVFTDFNKDLRLEINKKYLNTLKDLGLKVHIEDHPRAFTRAQKSGSSMTTSYLDYYFTLNAETRNFGISGRVSTSDHLLLSIEVLATQPVTIMKEQKINYKLLRKFAPYILDRIRNFDKSTSEDCLRSLNDLVIELRTRCPMQKHSPKSLFVEIEEVERELQKGKHDYSKINHLLLLSSRANYYKFLDLLEKLRLDGKSKEYYAKLAYLQRAECSYPFIEVLQDPTGGEDVIVDTNVIKKLLTDKYSKLFSKGREKISYFNATRDPLPSFSYGEILHAMMNVSKGKAVSHD